jgi:hypothetical protein
MYPDCIITSIYGQMTFSNNYDLFGDIIFIFKKKLYNNFTDGIIFLNTIKCQESKHIKN